VSEDVRVSVEVVSILCSENSQLKFPMRDNFRAIDLCALIYWKKVFGFRFKIEEIICLFYDIITVCQYPGRDLSSEKVFAIFA
jgi:hypothetical protein